MAILSEFQKLAFAAVKDQMLDDWGKPCKIWYPPVLEDCTECMNPTDITYAEGAGLHGGPIVNLCPFCGGRQKREKEVTDTIHLEIDYTNKLNRQTWNIEAPGVKMPYEVVTAQGYLTELPKLQRSIEILINLPGVPHSTGRYTLMDAGEDTFAIVQGRYFLASLKRVS